MALKPSPHDTLVELLTPPCSRDRFIEADQLLKVYPNLILEPLFCDCDTGFDRFCRKAKDHTRKLFHHINLYILLTCLHQDRLLNLARHVFLHCPARVENVIQYCMHSSLTIELCDEIEFRSKLNPFIIHSMIDSLSLMSKLKSYGLSYQFTESVEDKDHQIYLYLPIREDYNHLWPHDKVIIQLDQIKHINQPQVRSYNTRANTELLLARALALDIMENKEHFLEICAQDDLDTSIDSILSEVRGLNLNPKQLVQWVMNTIYSVDSFMTEHSMLNILHIQQEQDPLLMNIYLDEIHKKIKVRLSDKVINIFYLVSLGYDFVEDDARILNALCHQVINPKVGPKYTRASQKRTFTYPGLLREDLIDPIEFLLVIGADPNTIDQTLQLDLKYQLNDYLTNPSIYDHDESYKILHKTWSNIYKHLPCD